MKNNSLLKIKSYTRESIKRSLFLGCIFFLFTFLALLTGCIHKKEIRNVNALGREEIIIARRGYWGKFPESSLIGYREAKKIGAKLSADVLLTKDHQWVMLHDYNLKRLYCTNKNISELTYEEVSQILFCGPLAEEFDVGGIPLLKEYLDEFGSQTVEIEIKPMDNWPKEVQKKALDDLYFLAQPYLETLYFTSFSLNTILSLKSLDKNIKGGLVVHTQENLDQAIKNSELIDIMSIRYQLVTDESGKKLNEKKVHFWVYDMGRKIRKQNIKKLLKFRPAGFVVSYPIYTAEVLSGL